FLCADVDRLRITGAVPLRRLTHLITHLLIDECRTHIGGFHTGRFWTTTVSGRSAGSIRSHRNAEPFGFLYDFPEHPVWNIDHVDDINTARVERIDIVLCIGGIGNTGVGGVPHHSPDAFRVYATNRLARKQLTHGTDTN